MIPFKILSALVDEVIKKYLIIIEDLFFEGHLVLLLGLHLAIHLLGLLIHLLDLIVLELGGLLDEAEQGLVVDLGSTVHLVDLSDWVPVGVGHVVLQVLLWLFLEDDNLVLLEVLNGGIKDEVLTPLEPFIKALSHHLARQR